MNKTISPEDYTILEEADLFMDGAVASVLSKNGHANWTVCPSCGADDFCHVAGCSHTVQAAKFD